MTKHITVVLTPTEARMVSSALGSYTTDWVLTMTEMDEYGRFVKDKDERMICHQIITESRRLCNRIRDAIAATAPAD